MPILKKLYFKCRIFCNVECNTRHLARQNLLLLFIISNKIAIDFIAKRYNLPSVSREFVISWPVETHLHFLSTSVPATNSQGFAQFMPICPLKSKKPEAAAAAALPDSYVGVSRLRRSSESFEHFAFLRHLSSLRSTIHLLYGPIPISYL